MKEPFPYLPLAAHQLHSKAIDKEDIARAIEFYSQSLNGHEFIEDPKAFLSAICQKESSYGDANRPRYEPAYAPGGFYYQRSEDVRLEFRKWGAPAACSWGPMQIMFIVAIENGYCGSPGDLHHILNSMPYAVAQLNRIILRGADSKEKLACAYNHGTWKGIDVSKDEYTQTVLKYYKEFAKFGRA